MRISCKFPHKPSDAPNEWRFYDTNTLFTSSKQSHKLSLMNCWQLYVVWSVKNGGSRADQTVFTLIRCRWNTHWVCGYFPDVTQVKLGTAAVKERFMWNEISERTDIDIKISRHRRSGLAVHIYLLLKSIFTHELKTKKAFQAWKQ